jgi:hypothetical protein
VFGASQDVILGRRVDRAQDEHRGRTWAEWIRTRFGLTVTPEGQTFWLDTPDHVASLE